MGILILRKGVKTMGYRAISTMRQDVNVSDGQKGAGAHCFYPFGETWCGHEILGILILRKGVKTLGYRAISTMRHDVNVSDGRKGAGAHCFYPKWVHLDTTLDTISGSFWGPLRDPFWTILGAASSLSRAGGRASECFSQ